MCRRGIAFTGHLENCNPAHTDLEHDTHVCTHEKEKKKPPEPNIFTPMYNTFKTHLYMLAHSHTGTQAQTDTLFFFFASWKQCVDSTDFLCDRALRLPLLSGMSLLGVNIQICQLPHIERHAGTLANTVRDTAMPTTICVSAAVHRGSDCVRKKAGCSSSSSYTTHPAWWHSDNTPSDPELTLIPDTYPPPSSSLIPL